MFIWLELPQAVDAAALLPRAVDAGVACVPGAALYPRAPRANTMRLSFVSVPPEQIEAGIAILGRLLSEESA